jgi:hypothetical protein
MHVAFIGSPINPAPAADVVMPQRGSMASLKQKQIDAAQEFMDTTIHALKTDRGLHAETAIAATARMAWTFLFRSFRFSGITHH